MRKKSLYYKFSEFDEYFQNLKNRKIRFELISTSFTKRIKTSKYDIVFSKNGEREDFTLSLINSIRKDGKRYIESGGIIRDTYISWYDLVGNPNINKMIHKVDVKAAYWSAAIKKGVISDVTNEKFEEWSRGKTEKEIKNCRLKSLGSLATRKSSVLFVDGVRIKETEKYSIEETTPVYMEVAREVDDMMRHCSQNIKGCKYYYWDCMFVEEKHSSEVVEYFNSLGYGVKVSPTEIIYIDAPYRGYIKSISDDKIYSIRQESKVLLNQ